MKGYLALRIMWEEFNRTLPIFNNIEEAKQYIESLKYDQDFLQRLPYQCTLKEPNQEMFRDKDEDSFIMTPITCEPDDVNYFRMLCIKDGHPYLENFRRYSLKPNINNTFFLYRGQVKDYGSIKANLYREDSKGYFLDDMIRVQETTAVIAQHPLVQLLGIKGVELNGYNIKLQCNLYGLAQHYYNKTSEVDLSSSLDVASFFAVTKYENERYKPLYLSRDHMGILYVLPFCRQLSLNDLTEFKITSIGKQYCFERPARQLGFLIDCSNRKDLKYHPNLIEVRFRHVPNKTREIFESFNNGIDIAPEDPLTKYWRRYRVKKSDSVFEISNKAIQLNLYWNPEETEDSIREKIMDYTDKNDNPCFKFSDNEWPEFPTDWLDDYYQDIKNGWWEDEFCSNIYSANKKVNVDTLLTLPSDPRYRYAFYRS